MGKFHQGRRSATVLVIEDDLSLQALATHTLRSEGYHVIPATDAPQALQSAALHAGGIDLILTDINLPTGNGMSLATELVKQHPNTPVLYMSGLTVEAIQQVQHHGAPDGGFLEKPFSPKTLVARVREILPPPEADAPPPIQTSASPLASDTSHSAAQSPTEAVYRLESAVRCPQCSETISTLRAIRLLRAEVNFTSTLPRRGRVLTCPCCHSIIPAELTNF